MSCVVPHSNLVVCVRACLRWYALESQEVGCLDVPASKLSSELAFTQLACAYFTWGLSIRCCMEVKQELRVASTDVITHRLLCRPVVCFGV
jgi:hypothetical protein